MYIENLKSHNICCLLDVTKHNTKALGYWTEGLDWPVCSPDLPSVEKVRQISIQNMKQRRLVVKMTSLESVQFDSCFRTLYLFVCFLHELLLDTD